MSCFLESYEEMSINPLERKNLILSRISEDDHICPKIICPKMTIYARETFIRVDEMFNKLELLASRQILLNASFILGLFLFWIIPVVIHDIFRTESEFLFCVSTILFFITPSILCLTNWMRIRNLIKSADKIYKGYCLIESHPIKYMD